MTHPGLRRKENQDRYFIREFEDQTVLSAVADGMGGEAGGGLAAQTAIEAFKDFNTNLANVEDSFAAVFQVADRGSGKKSERVPNWKEWVRP